MIFINELQKETLLLVDKLIEQNKTYEDILYVLMLKNYQFIIKIKNGYANKTRIELYKSGENSFVTLIKKRNGFANWETIKLS